MHQVVIIGSGFAGLGAGIKLKEAGVDDFVILERAASLGSTWRDNTYPGCACDVQSHVYSFSFAPNPNWSRKYAPQPEILAYLEQCADRYSLRPHLRFNADVIEARFDEASASWLVKTRDGQQVQGRALIAGLGGLSNASIPSFEGTFAGPSFHSSKWNHSVSLKGKRVAVVGSAASAIQLVPSIATDVARLDLYQRTPSWVMPKPDRPLHRWERWLFSHAPFTQRVLRGLMMLALDARVIAFTRWPALMALLAIVTRWRLKQLIPNEQLRETVTPSYLPGCKRLLLSNDFLPALTLDHVNVITTPISRLEPTGLVTSDGTLREVDVIIYATGFTVQTPVPRGTIFGLHGQDLLDAWRSGPEAYLGICVSGFPNLFFLGGPNTGLGHSSVVIMIEAQLRYVMQALAAMRREHLRAIDVKPSVQTAFVTEIDQALRRTVWASGCRSWYLNEAGRNTTLWPGSTLAYRARTSSFSLANFVSVDPPMPPGAP